MEENGIIPHIIDVIPKHKVQIAYSGDLEVDFGNELTPLQVKEAPVTVQWPIEEEQYYTFIMIDPDAPSRGLPLFGPVKHWLVMNIPGTDLAQGENIAPYIGAGPPEGTGFHRYVFLVYKQTGLLKHSETAIEDKSHVGRMRFKLNNFTDKYNLGQPIAANFFLAQNDEYVKEEWQKRTSGSFRGRLERIALSLIVKLGGRS